MRDAYIKANLDKILQPVWNTNIIHSESIMLLEENGEVSAPLLYEPAEILAVQNASQTETYENGRDYTYENGRLKRLPDSRMFYFTQEQLYPENGISGASFRKVGGGNILHAEGHYFHDCQIAVTYTCENGRWPGEIPAFAGDLLPKTMQKLTQDKALRLVLFGDSISTGANASGVMGAPPFMPPFGLLLSENLRRHYGAEIEFINPSVGGTDSHWGIAEAEARVCASRPDLVILGFGMNDSLPGPAFAENMAEMQAIVRKSAPETEFILIATSLPNPLAQGFTHHQQDYGAALAPLCGAGTALCDIGKLQQTLLTRKRFIDITGNHVNHPNDFFARLHAQSLSALLIP